MSRGGEGVERDEQGRRLGVGRVNRKGVGSDVVSRGRGGEQGEGG